MKFAIPLFLAGQADGSGDASANQSTVGVAANQQSGATLTAAPNINLTNITGIPPNINIQNLAQIQGIQGLANIQGLQALHNVQVSIARFQDFYCINSCINHLTNKSDL